jgi:hypothetical protein
MDDETELLLPDNLLHSDSPIRKLVASIDEDDWQEVEIIGWLYQFYISEKKDEVIGKVVKSEDIPAATQLFTPNWIVKYLVQNSLGRQWMATYPDSPLKAQMEYYIEPAEQTPEVQEQLKAITPTELNPEELTLLDPACGSGHILVEAYDLLKAIYQERGYRARDIPRLILEKNLYGLEIDDRAAQLAAFALMMKARADDRRIFDAEVKLNVMAIQDSKGLDAKEITEALNRPIRDGSISDITQADVAHLIELFEHGNTFGSLTQVPNALNQRLTAIAQRGKAAIGHGEMFEKVTARAFTPLVEQAQVLTQQYAFVVTNPPYMGGRFYEPLVKRFTKDRFPESRTDLYGCFLERCIALVRPEGILGMITIPNWMFLSSFEGLRRYILANTTATSLVHNGRGVWGSDFGSCMFALRRDSIPDENGTYRRLFSKQGEVNSNDELQQHFLDTTAFPRFSISANDVLTLPGAPLAYWTSEETRRALSANSSLATLAEPKQGLATGNNDLFLRRWFEVPSEHIAFCCTTQQEAQASGKMWFPYNKGGDFRKWYGNREYVVNWQNDGCEIRNYRDQNGKLMSRPQNTTFFLKILNPTSSVTDLLRHRRLHDGTRYSLLTKPGL